MLEVQAFRIPLTSEMLSRRRSCYPLIISFLRAIGNVHLLDISMYRAFKIEMKMIRRELWKQLRRLTKTVTNENQKNRKFCSKCRKLLANSDTLSG